MTWRTPRRGQHTPVLLPGRCCLFRNAAPPFAWAGFHAVPAERAIRHFRQANTSSALCPCCLLATETASPLGAAGRCWKFSGRSPFPFTPSPRTQESRVWTAPALVDSAMLTNGLCGCNFAAELAVHVLQTLQLAVKHKVESRYRGVPFEAIPPPCGKGLIRYDSGRYGSRGEAVV